ncbi:MAG TPA: NADH-quinone oxidoreductase subunit NuoK [Bdellovibrionota bacterium]|nr:NADH-quinone oxidoreductase subunit NuoK [Bdellovibrionota bacterium]
MNYETLLLITSAGIFSIGLAGMLTRRNALILFMSIELILNAVNLAFASFCSQLQSLDGQIFIFFVMTVAAAEAAVGLGIIIAIYRTRKTIDLNELRLLQG